jgi:phage terminase large subunit-like protein
MPRSGSLPRPNLTPYSASSWPSIARARALARGTTQAAIGSVPLLDLVPRLSPHLDRPDHLAPYAAILEAFPGGGLRQILAAPPQHGKTILTSHGLVKWLAGATKSYGYATYNQDRADAVARSVRALAFEAGLGPTGPVREWKVDTGAAIKFTSIGSALTGFPLQGGLVVDDPIKDREEAESKRKRDRAWDWLQEVGLTRLHPGASALIMATRWHVDDLSGRCIRDGWPYLNLRAVSTGQDDPLGRPAGAPLWPARRPLSFLQDHQRNAFAWASLWQGEPRPRGGAVFGEPHRYQDLPSQGYSLGWGLDLAYSSRTSSDWSIAVELRSIGADPRTALYYVASVIRFQGPAPQFGALVSHARGERGGRVIWYAAGPERGTADYMDQAGVPVEVWPATADKFTRAIGVAAAWNEGRVLVPDSAPWLPEFLDTVCGFTGVQDKHDDDVDALTAAFDGLQTSSGFYILTTHA